MAICESADDGYASCVKVASARLAAGDKDGAMLPLGLACRRIGSACLDLGEILLGRATTEDERTKAMIQFGSGCLSRQGDSCGWIALDYLGREMPAATRAFVVEGKMDSSCRYPSGGWTCFNYGVALTCGLLGPPDISIARSAWSQGCYRGDVRACEMGGAFTLPNPKMPSCDLIGPDPEHPVKLELNLEPLPLGALQLEGEKPFKRRSFP